MINSTSMLSASESAPGNRRVSLVDAIRELASAIRGLAERAPRDPHALLTAEELGALFGLSPRTLKDRAAAGALPHRRFGKHYRFSREDVAEIVRITGCSVRPYPGGRRAA